MNKDCIIIHANCGEGHLKAAQAISGHFGFESIDMLDFSHPLIRKIYSQGYRFVVKHLVFVWAMLFESARFKFIRAIVDRMHFVLFHRLDVYLRENKPKIVILTHFFPTSFITRLKSLYGIKIITIVTDFCVHPLWINEKVDFYLVATIATRDELISKGVRVEKIKVTGLPLRDGFREPCDVEQIRKDLSFDAKPIVFIFSSTQGNTPHLKRILTELIEDFNFIVIYGTNIKSKKLINTLNSNSIKGFPYYERIWELMSVSFAMITKPGGLTTSEGLYKRKPFLFTHFIWGQEKGNLDMVVKLGVGFYTPTFKKIKETLFYLIKNPDLYKNFKLDGEDIFSCIENLTRD